MGERGPLPSGHARRRNRRNVAGTIAVGRPAKPRKLVLEARAEWDRVVPELEQVGTLTSIDRGLLIRYCIAWADWVELDDMLQQTGKLVRGQKGNVVRNPAWLMRRDAEATVTQLGKQLGLSPAARLRAGIVHESLRLEEQPPPGVAAIADYRRRLGG